MRTILMITAILMLFLLTACNDSGTLKVTNNSSYNVYMKIDGHNYIVPGQGTRSVDVHTGTQNIFTGVVERNVPLEIFGETWMMWITENGERVYVKDTKVKVSTGETTKIYCWPNLACVKIKNHGTQAITAMTYTTHLPPFGETTKQVALPDSIPTNGEFFTSFPGATEDNLVYFTFQLRLSDGTWISYGNTSTILYADDEYIIDVYDQGRQVAGRY